MSVTLAVRLRRSNREWRPLIPWLSFFCGSERRGGLRSPIHSLTLGSGGSRSGCLAHGGRASPTHARLFNNRLRPMRSRAFSGGQPGKYYVSFLRIHTGCSGACQIIQMDSSCAGFLKQITAGVGVLFLGQSTGGVGE